MAERHDDVHYEPRDVRIGPVVWFLVGLATALAMAMLSLWWTQSMYVHPPSARPHNLPPEPRIEGVGLDQATHSVTNVDMPTSARSQKLREDQMLRDGWTDAAGKRHPPIIAAIKQLLEREARR